jgi:hypothetical protein
LKQTTEKSRTNIKTKKREKTGKTQKTNKTRHTQRERERERERERGETERKMEGHSGSYRPGTARILAWLGSIYPVRFASTGPEV